MKYKLALIYTGLWCAWMNASTLHIEAFGDSLTAGFLSDTQVTSPPSLSEVSNVITDMALSFRLKDRSVLAKYHAPKTAWPMQLASRLKKQGLTDVEVHNYAVSGNRSYDMLNQIKRSTQKGRTVAFFFIGHNDLCDEYDSAENMALNYKLGVKDALKEWARTHKDAEAFILPIGKVDEVFALLTGFVWKKSATHNFTCEENWDRYFPYCRVHYKRLKAGTLDAFLKDRLKLMNKGLDEIVQERQKEDSKNTYTYLSTTHDSVYAKEHFAVDCYHLSPDGQQALAKRVLNETSKLTTF